MDSSKEEQEPAPENEVPQEFINFMAYCRNLKFEEKPDYNYLRKEFKDLFNKRGYEYDYVYDWNILEKKNRRKEAEKKR